MRERSDADCGVNTYPYEHSWYATASVRASCWLGTTSGSAGRALTTDWQGRQYAFYEENADARVL